MTEDVCLSTADEREEGDEQEWRDLYGWLFSLIKIWVYHAHIMIWYGQVSEVAEEITQETLLRAFEYVQSARRKEKQPVVHLRAFCYTTARHIFVDRIRKEKRMVRLAFDNDVYARWAARSEQANPEEIALTHLMLEESIVAVARAIVNFPGKQKAALLTHFASTADFNVVPSHLERALADEGIHLRDYVRQPSDDSSERNRQASLLWHACQRLKREV